MLKSEGEVDVKMKSTTDHHTGRWCFSPCAMCGGRVREVLRTEATARGGWLTTDVSSLYHFCMLPFQATFGSAAFDVVVTDEMRATIEKVVAGFKAM